MQRLRSSILLHDVYFCLSLLVFCLYLISRLQSFIEARSESFAKQKLLVFLFKMETNLNVTPCGSNERSRRPKRNREKWKAIKAKIKRYVWYKFFSRLLNLVSYLFRHSSKKLPEHPKCKHADGALKCKTLTMQEIRKFHENFYRSKNKSDQDTFMLKYIVTSQKKRLRAKNNKYNAPNFRSKYFVPAKNMRLVPVCLQTFTSILDVSRFRINIMVKKFMATGQMPTEARGGNRKKDVFKAKKEAVMKFLNQLKCVESHYCRSSISYSRMYLSSDLNIKKLYRMYDGIPVKQSYFRHIFNSEYNLGFGTPRTDVCSTCLELGEKIKFTVDGEEKQTLMAQKRVHKLRAEAFFQLLRENKSNMLVLSYDCQKNQPLPKVPDQATYYSRQVYVYNFTVVKGFSKGKLNPTTVTSYCWTENQFPKGSNEIASCVYDALQTSDLSEITTVRLVSDGCAGQNKNSTLIGMVMAWLISAPPNVKWVEIIFPVTGHSYIPPDRVFGQSEKEIKRKEVILKPEEYEEIFSHYAKVKKLGKDCHDFNWKEAIGKVIRLPGSWHFKLMQCKRLLIQRNNNNRILIQGELYYKNSLGVAKNICKQGQSFNDLRPNIIPETNKLKKEKKVDINNLLSKHYGTEWRSIQGIDLSFYSRLLDGPENPSAVEEEPDELCEHQEENSDLRI